MKKLLLTSSVLAIVTGIILVIGGIWGIFFTYGNVTREHIVTPKDAAIVETPVRGPFTLKAQADIMRKHVLKTTGGKTYAEMPRQVQKLDESGKPVLDKDGKEVIVSNSTRDMWVTYTALTTALNLGILTYAFSGMIVLFGCISLWTGFVFLAFSKSYVRQ